MKYMLLTTLPPMVFALAMYWFLGRNAVGTVEGEHLSIIISTLHNNFSLNPILILPPLAVLILVAMHKPALPTFAAGIFIACILALIFQDVSLKDVSNAIYSGYSKETGVQVVDKMILRGGIKSMLATLAIPIGAAFLELP